MKIQKCHIENFTVFSKTDIEFCDGVNVIIGTNGTGKSHLLKILYAMVQTACLDMNNRNGKKTFKSFTLLNGVFKPEEDDIRRMIRSKKTLAILDIQSDIGLHHTEIQSDHHFIIAESTPDEIVSQSWQSKQDGEKAGIFIPPNEVLSMYPGFAASYEKRELSFDQTYYDICKALAANPLRQKNEVLSKLIPDLEEILGGQVVQKGDHFYVQNKTGKKRLEAHLMAEGHRKIAALVHLINNGAIDKGKILFWDEPEANLNPKLIKSVANLLRGLAAAGVQVFIATHDYLLTGELSLAAEYNTQPEVPIRFFAMSRKGDRAVTIQSGDTLADLHDNAILDEFAAHYQREQDAFIQHMKVGTIE